MNTDLTGRTEKTAKAADLNLTKSNRNNKREPNNKTNRKYMKNITFNSKETYLAYRSLWKAEYKKISGEIRTLRLGDRLHQRKTFGHLALTESEEGIITAAMKVESPETGPVQPSIFDYVRRRRSLRATEMLAELKEAKLEAQRQYLARKAAETGR